MIAYLEVIINIYYINRFNRELKLDDDIIIFFFKLFLNFQIIIQSHSL